MDKVIKVVLFCCAWELGKGQFKFWQRIHQDRTGIEIEMSKFGELLEGFKKKRFFKECENADLIIVDAINHDPLNHFKELGKAEESMAGIAEKVCRENPKTRVYAGLFQNAYERKVHSIPGVMIHPGFSEYNFFVPILAQIAKEK